MNFLTGSPKILINPPTRKNLNPLPNTDDARKTIKLILQTPAAIVKILYGIGVKPETNTAQKALSPYRSFTWLKTSGVNPGTYVKKKLLVYSHIFIPIKYPHIPPATDPSIVMRLYSRALAGFDTQRAINKTSGGIRKQEASVKANVNNAGIEYLELAQLNTQLYNLLIISLLLIPSMFTYQWHKHTSTDIFDFYFFIDF